MIDPKTEFDLKLTADAVNVVMGALSEAPYRIAAPVIETIRRQIVAVEPTAFDTPQAAPSPPPAANGVDHAPN
jgi:hypothetical protein